MQNDRVEQQLERLRTIRLGGPSAAATIELRKALKDRVNVIAAKAAAIVDEWQEQTLVPSLLEAFDRLFVKPTANDPQCWGKTAIAKALKNCNVAASAVFLRGLRYRQWESTWGGKVDTAAALRSTCTLALVQCADLPRHETLAHLVDALADAEAQVRSDAARALEQMGGREAALVLRLKARTGDREAAVNGQVFESVVNLEGVRGVAFVAEFLKDEKAEVFEEAALALGASRLPEAVEMLRAEWLSRGHHAESILLRAISVSRQEAAIEFLLGLVRTGQRHAAEDALRALEFYRDSTQIREQIKEAASQREELIPIIRELFSKLS